MSLEDLISKCSRSEDIRSESFGGGDDFLLYGVVFGTSMINPEFGQKPMSLELSLDNCQLSEYGLASKTASVIPMLLKENYMCLPESASKGALGGCFAFQDNRIFSFLANHLGCISENLRSDLIEIEDMMAKDDTGVKFMIKQALCQCVRDLECFLEIIREKCASAKQFVTPQWISSVRHHVHTIVGNFSRLASEIQERDDKCCCAIVEESLIHMENSSRDLENTCPDILLWLRSDNTRVALKRISARTILYSNSVKERGKEVGIMQTLFLEMIPDDKKPIMSMAIQAKVIISLWLGLSSERVHVLDELPSGYIMDEFFKNIDNLNYPLPDCITYIEKTQYEIRAYIQQAQLLLESKTGLSNTYIRLSAFNEYQKTHVVLKSLTPVWNRELVIRVAEILNVKRLHDRPPVFVIDVFGVKRWWMKSDVLLGTALISPTVRLACDLHSTGLPILKWYKLAASNEEYAGNVLLAFELVEVLFWGLRSLEKLPLQIQQRPHIEILCGNQTLQSSVLKYGTHQNFVPSAQHMDVNLPEQEDYRQPIVIHVVDKSIFAAPEVLGTHNINFLKSEIHEAEQIEEEESWSIQSESQTSKHFIIDFDITAMKTTTGELSSFMEEEEEEEEDDNEDEDWWTRYYSSRTEVHEHHVDHSIAETANEEYKKGMIIYGCELEKIFGNFEDFLKMFPLYSGNPERIVGTFKGSVKLCKIPASSGHHCSPETKGRMMFFKNVPSNDPTQVLVRLHIIRGIDLTPKDWNGQLDSYVQIQLGSRDIINDKENYIPKQTNPLFGKCFSFTASFPDDFLLTIKVFDRDIVGADDLVGSTKIDLENRFYSHHRASCGIPQKYELKGPNGWRDPESPTSILRALCHRDGISGPFFYSNAIEVGDYTFSLPGPSTEFVSQTDRTFIENTMALEVLNKWEEVAGIPLVKEHVETRSLFHPQISEEQGKIEMWIDLFQYSNSEPVKRNIGPRQPKDYELRVIIWDTKDVILVDRSVLTGQSSTDIYILGTLAGLNKQKTDVHAKSQTGEGFFNWRFIFVFAYLHVEKQIVYSKKKSHVSWDKTEIKLPPNLCIDIWDADYYSSDDYLGSISFDLNHIPREAKSAEECTLEMLQSGASASIFKRKHIRGWWPAFTIKNGKQELAGKLHMQFDLLTAEEAEETPAGRGRDGPDPLEAPERPQSERRRLRIPFGGAGMMFKKLIQGPKKLVCGIVIIVVLVIFFNWVLPLIRTLTGI